MSSRLVGSRVKALPPAVMQELETLETELGGRDTLIGLLTLAPLNKDLQYTLGLLGDPQHARTPLATICALGNILPSQLVGYLQQAALVRGQLRASVIVGERIPATVADVMEKSAPHEKPCTTCRGTGSVMPEPTATVPNPVHQPCDTCLGYGKLLYPADEKAQAIALDLARLLPKGGGFNIAIQQNNAGGGTGRSAGGGTLEQLQELTDQLLHGSPDVPVVDGQIEPPA